MYICRIINPKFMKKKKQNENENRVFEHDFYINKINLNV